jgi:hypothetical protein
MQMSTIIVPENDSAMANFAPLIVTLRTADRRECEIVVGYPGLQNVARTLSTGDALLFETPNNGILEIRLMYADVTKGRFLISQVSPRSSGLAVGLISDDPSNGKFSSDELLRIKESIQQLKADLQRKDLFSFEQLDLISRKLDDIESASRRLGRKDWIAYVAGTLTTMCVSAAFAPEAARTLFESASAAFDWLFSNALLLLT